MITLTRKDVWERYTLRSSVERLAAQLVAAAIDARKRKALLARFTALEKACASGNERVVAEAEFAYVVRLIGAPSNDRTPVVPAVSGVVYLAVMPCLPGAVHRLSAARAA